MTSRRGSAAAQADAAGRTGDRADRGVDRQRRSARRDQRARRRRRSIRDAARSRSDRRPLPEDVDPRQGRPRRGDGVRRHWCCSAPSRVKAGHQKGEVDSYSTKVILAREARIISCLEHPNIIPIYDAGTDPARGPFYVMRQVTETSLEMILHQRKTGEGDPHDYTLNRLLRYFLQVCNAVDYAHHRGVIHCDIKPANILLGDYGEVLLVDWGLAQSRNHPLGVRGGTLGYMAPEQMDRDDRAARLAHRRVRARRDPLRDPVRRAGVRGGAQLRRHRARQGSVAIYKTPPLPSTRRRGLEIPHEVEDICMRRSRSIATSASRPCASSPNAIDEWIEGSQAERAPAHRGRQERRCRRRARRALSRVRRVAPREADRVPRAARRRRAVGARSTTSRICGTPRTSSASPTRCRCARSTRRCRRTSARSMRCRTTRARAAASRACTGPSCNARAIAARRSTDRVRAAAARGRRRRRSCASCSATARSS